MARGMIDAELEKALDKLSGLSVDILPEGTDEATVQRIKDELGRTNVHEKDGDGGTRTDRTVGLIIVPREAVIRGEKGYGQIETFWPDKVDFEIRQRVHRRVGDAVIDARIAADTRLTAAGLNSGDLRRILDRPAAADKVMTARGEKRSGGELALMIPAGFMLLLMIAVMSAGRCC